jgi:hypothetical protein
MANRMQPSNCLGVNVHQTSGSGDKACFLSEPRSANRTSMTYPKERRSPNSPNPRILSRIRSLTLVFLPACATSLLTPAAYGLPSYARQTGQRCAACHVGGNWPQLTPWGRFFKLSGYSTGKTFVDREGFEYVPGGVLMRAGLTWAAEPKNSQGQTVIEHSGDPQFYNAFGTIGTKFTDWAGVFAEYGVNNTFPGWKGVEGPVDIRATRFLHPAGHELLVGFDSNNAPTVQDVWNTIPAWSYPFYGSPQAPGAPASPMIANLPNGVGSVGAYALLDRHFYAEVSMYRVGDKFFRFMNGGTSFERGAPYLDGWNPYFRAYWTTQKGPNSFLHGWHVWNAGQSFSQQCVAARLNQYFPGYRR